jgi:NTP pyrophosphatase (non-canonical NTP hydrolase)
MDFNTYQSAARATALYPDDLKLIYPALGVAGECGEVVEQVKKMIRDDNRTLSPERRAALCKEMGDVLWYLACLAHDAGIPLDDVATANIAKIQDRKNRGVLHGAGDER